jgi:N6-adenosine-specific RNA methylase IME4
MQGVPYAPKGEHRKPEKVVEQSVQQPSREAKNRTAKAAAAKVNKGAVARGDKLVKERPDLAEKVRKGEMKPAEAHREMKREEIIAKLEDTKTKETKAIEGLYDVIVIDPPWPMKKIERDVRPNQSEFEYPTMTEDELAGLNIPMTDDCHVWLWTTHKFLPMALRLLGSWGLKYVCTFVWHKPGGFQPIGLPQYNCEMILYARKGSPSFIDTKAFPVCFNAPRGKHSEKPEEFYETLRRVTAGRRIDMFNRRAIDGFDGWGNESNG